MPSKWPQTPCTVMISPVGNRSTTNPNPALRATAATNIIVPYSFCGYRISVYWKPLRASSSHLPFEERTPNKPPWSVPKPPHTRKLPAFVQLFALAAFRIRIMGLGLKCLASASRKSGVYRIFAIFCFRGHGLLLQQRCSATMGAPRSASSQRFERKGTQSYRATQRIS